MKDERGRLIMSKENRPETKDEMMARLVKIQDMTRTISSAPESVRDEANRLIQEHLDALDTHIEVTSQQFNDSKNEFLDTFSEDDYPLPESNGYTPLYDDRGNPSPVTAHGFAAKTVEDAYNGLTSAWSELATYDSIEAFNERYVAAKIEYELDFGEGTANESSLSSEDIMADSFHKPQRGVSYDFEPYSTFDDISVDTFKKFTHEHILEIEERLDATLEDYPYYIEENPWLEPEDDSYGLFIESLKTAKYKENYAIQENTDDLMFDNVVKSDFTRAPISKRKDYEQLLFGLYDHDKEEVMMSGLKDDFENAVDLYFDKHEASLSDLYDLDGTDNPKMNQYAVLDFMVDVSGEMGFSKGEAREIIDVLDYEERMYMEKGQLYAARDLGGYENLVTPGSPDDRYKWIPEGFEHVYGQPMDFNSDFYRHKFEENRVEIEMDESEMMARRSSGTAAFDMQSQDNELFDVALNERISPNFGFTKENVSNVEKMSLFLKELNERDEGISEDLDGDVLYKFEYDVNNMAQEWDIDENIFNDNPEFFVDWLAETTNRTLAQLDTDGRNHGEGHRVVTSSLGHDIQQEQVAKFLENYKAVYKAPIHAANLTMDQVNENVGYAPIDSIDGELNYKDVREAESPEMLERLRREKQREIEDEIYNEVDDGGIDF